MIDGTVTGSPTIHVLNTTASAIESLTLSWWCSSIGDLRERQRAIVAVFAVTSAIAGNSRTKIALPLLDVAVCQRH